MIPADRDAGEPGADAEFVEQTTVGLARHVAQHDRVAIVDARKLDYYHALEEEHAGLVLLDEAETGLRQLLAGQRVASNELTLALSDQ